MVLADAVARVEAVGFDGTILRNLSDLRGEMWAAASHVMRDQDVPDHVAFRQ